jgi:DNA-binding XRE family transcriptional regulator
MSNNLRELRIKSCLSQRDLAKKSGITTSTIVTIEKCRHHPQFITIRKLAKALGVETSELYFND